MTGEPRQPPPAESPVGAAKAAFEQGRFAAAETVLQARLAERPDDDLARLNLGLALRQLGRDDEAAAALAEVLARYPQQPHALFHLANLTMPRDRPEAERLLARLLLVEPHYPQAASLLGTLLMQRGQAVAAEPLLRAAVLLEPASDAAITNLGGCLMSQRRSGEAEPWYRRAIAVAPGNPFHHKNLAGCLLLVGQLAEGWAEYEWRLRQPGWRWRQEFTGRPQWQGEDLAGRTILVHDEQGLGDLFQFVRYLALLKAKGARTILQCDRSMVRLLRRVPGVDQLVAAGDPLPPFDFFAPMMSVPRFCSPTVEAIPAGVPYLSAEPDLAARWRTRMPPGHFSVGIHWQASTDEKSIPLRAFAPFSALPGARLYSLQQQVGLDQLARHGGELGITAWPDAETGPDRFVDTAAIIANLDLVVCCDSSIAHLAGAMGVPTFLILPYQADWRWMRHPHRTAWYPNTRLFRRGRNDDWPYTVSLASYRAAASIAGLVLPDPD